MRSLREAEIEFSQFSLDYITHKLVEKEIASCSRIRP